MRPHVVVAVLLATLSVAARAQESLLPSTAWGFGPIISGWRFSTPIATASGAIKHVAQAAVPFRVRAVLGGRWSFDVTGAYASAAIHTAPSDSSSGQGGKEEDVTLLSGLTDLKVRLNGPLAGDKLVLAAGVNLPTGTTRLDNNQTAVLQAVGAPALRMPIGAYGTGIGATLGVVSAIERGAWALAFGASVEQRTEYTPIALAISGGSSETRLTPGTAAHVTFGADRVIGAERLSVLLLADAFGTDKVVIFGGGTESGRTQYRLGPQFAALTRLDFGGGAWSEGAVNLSARYRSVFSDADGAQVSGSAGTYLDASVGGVLGGGGGAGLVFGLDGRWHSGLPFTSALVGAAATVGGVTLGVAFPSGFRFAVHPQYGTFDTGTTRTTGVGGTIILSFGARREAR